MKPPDLRLQPTVPGCCGIMRAFGRHPMKYAAAVTQTLRSGSEYGCVTRFQVRSEFMSQFEVQQVGGGLHTEWWVPAERLEELNANIVGKIEVIREFGVR
jgi:hypothetical protein